MSRASKHVEWCLRKAEQEISECKKLGKGEKHRGLIRIKPNVNEAEKHLKKAEHYLEVTDYLINGKFSDISMSTIFYTMYQCFLSIASKFGYESGNQSCTISLIEWLLEENKININKRFLKYFHYNEDESVIELREDYTYGTDIEMDDDRINFFINECKELIDETKQVIYASENEE